MIYSGTIICDNCSKHRVLVEHVDAVNKVRVCDDCFEELNIDGSLSPAPSKTLSTSLLRPASMFKREKAKMIMEHVNKDIQRIGTTITEEEAVDSKSAGRSGSLVSAQLLAMAKEKSRKMSAFPEQDTIVEAIDERESLYNNDSRPISLSKSHRISLKGVVTDDDNLESSSLSPTGPSPPPSTGWQPSTSYVCDDISPRSPYITSPPPTPPPIPSANPPQGYASTMPSKPPPPPPPRKVSQPPQVEVDVPITPRKGSVAALSSMFETISNSPPRSPPRNLSPPLPPPPPSARPPAALNQELAPLSEPIERDSSPSPTASPVNVPSDGSPNVAMGFKKPAPKSGRKANMGVSQGVALPSASPMMPLQKSWKQESDG
jgi:hypothetical protein